MSVINNEEKEKTTAQVFCQWFNEMYGNQHKAIKDKYDEEADYQLVDQVNKKNILLQITSCDKNAISTKVKAHENPGEAQACELDYIRTIEEAIKRKRYSPEIREKIILLIYSDYARINGSYLRNTLEPLYRLKHVIKNIYLVTLPKDTKYCSHPSRGYVTRIHDKNATSY